MVPHVFLTRFGVDVPGADATPTTKMSSALFTSCDFYQEKTSGEMEEKI
jgi:hypothetical protein